MLAFDSFSGDENATGRSWLYDLGEHTLVDLGAAGEWPSVYLDESQVAWSDGRQLRRATWAG